MFSLSSTSDGFKSHCSEILLFMILLYSSLEKSFFHAAFSTTLVRSAPSKLFASSFKRAFESDEVISFSIFLSETPRFFNVSINSFETVLLFIAASSFKAPGSISKVRVRSLSAFPLLSRISFPASRAPCTDPLSASASPTASPATCEAPPIPCSKLLSAFSCPKSFSTEPYKFMALASSPPDIRALYVSGRDSIISSISFTT